MARIAGIDIPRNKRVEIALTYIFGIGRKTSNDILKEANVNPGYERVNRRRSRETKKHHRNQYKVEGELRKEIRLNIKRLVDIRCFRGLRHKANLPVRGQRTKTNARTRKGPVKAAVKKKK